MFSRSGDKVAAYSAAAQARGGSAPVHQCCNNCRKPAAPGARLRSCGKCGIFYCSTHCQREHWQQGHKALCGKNWSPETSEVGKVSKKADRGAKEWYVSLPDILLKFKVMALAWAHREETPLILVQTSASSVDMSDSCITMIPRSSWETGHVVGGLGIVRGNPMVLRQYMVDSGLRPDVEYYVASDCNHVEASASLSGLIQNIFFEHNMDVVLAFGGMYNANTFDALNSAIVQAETVLKNTLASAMVDDEAADTYARLTKIVNIYAKTKSLGVGNKIRLMGLTPQFNGREGIILLGKNQGREVDQDSELFCGLDDGTQVSNVTVNETNVCVYSRRIPSEFQHPHSAQLRAKLENFERRRNISSLDDPLEIDQRVRLFGLQGAAHLNGREGRVKREDPNKQSRVQARLECGEDVSVKGTNLERI